MKGFIVLAFVFTSAGIFAQTNDALLKHYQAYYTQMKQQGDMQGVINALTHLNILAPSEARKDTLAYLYTNGGKYLQALNTIGIEKNETASDLNVQTKALALKQLNQPKRALEQYEILFNRKPNPYTAYELADLKLQTGDFAGADVHINYGLTNAKDDMKYAFYETQRPYEVSLKAAFTHLKGLAQFNKDQNNPDAAIAIMDEALALAPNFNLAAISKQALEARKNQPKDPENNKN